MNHYKQSHLRRKTLKNTWDQEESQPKLESSQETPVLLKVETAELEPLPHVDDPYWED
jgi:hypothetical protein